MHCWASWWNSWTSCRRRAMYAGGWRMCVWGGGSEVSWAGCRRRAMYCMQVGFAGGGGWRGSWGAAVGRGGEGSFTQLRAQSLKFTQPSAGIKWSGGRPHLALYFILPALPHPTQMFTQVSSGLGGDPRQLALGLDGFGAPGGWCCADTGRRHWFELPGQGPGFRVKVGVPR